MSERRASMRPPEMMNGSTKGRVSSCSSTLAMCTCGHVEEVQLAAPALERTSCPELEHPSDKSVLREKHERVRSEEHTSELQSLAYLVCRLLLEKKKKTQKREIG